MKTVLPYNEQELLRRVSRGDEAAFKILFDGYRERIYYYIAGFVKSGQVAEELVIDVFMKIWLGRELAPQIENFDAFLFRVAHNKSIDFLRTAAKDERLKQLLFEQIQAVSSEYADAPVFLAEYEKKLREAIHLLSPQRRKVYQLSRDQEMTHDQIAAKLNISSSTVNNHITEAQRFIKNYLLKSFDLAVLILFFGRI